jgi:RimJ/RimL family protein N-acetyltransferase
MTPIKLISDVQKKEVLTHLLSLDREDLRLRFGYTPTDSIIEKYVNDSWDKKGNQWFGVYDSKVDGLIATLHVALMNHSAAEIGCTVYKQYRKHGIGNNLFVRGSTWAKSFGVKEIYMYCLSENKAIQKIAKNNKMHVVTIEGGEAEATLSTPYDPMASIKDVLLDRIAVYDMLLLNQQKFFTKFLR